jgi:hypothetical protein
MSSDRQLRDIPTAGRVVDCLRSAIVDAGAGLADVPQLLKQVIVEELWRERKSLQSDEHIQFKNFVEFIHAKPPEGLGCDLSTLKKLCRDDVEALDLLSHFSSVRARGGDRRSKNFKLNNVKFDLPATGNSVDYALDRLRRDRPDLHRAVLSGSISANRAMISAGFRKKKIQINADVFSFVKFISKNFSPDEITELVDRLNREINEKSCSTKRS